MYIAFKILHVVAVVIFLGNLITGILWKVHADQRRLSSPQLSLSSGW